MLRSFANVRADRAVLQGVATAVLVGTCGTMFVAAHAGGSLTHGEDFLTEHAPTPIRLLVGLPVLRDRSEEPLTAIADGRPSMAWPCASSKRTVSTATTRAR